MDKSAHPVEVVKTYEEVLTESALKRKFIEIDGGYKIHVVEAGKGPPVVMLHGTGDAAFAFSPLLQHFESVLSIVPDRPGSGLSDPVGIRRKGYRDWALEVIDQMLEALGVDEVSLAGASGGACGRFGTRWRFPNACSASFCLRAYLCCLEPMLCYQSV
jgi:2-hydroxy-6-oxonona-2,4-dienedioate hydrolase